MDSQSKKEKKMSFIDKVLRKRRTNEGQYIDRVKQRHQREKERLKDRHDDQMDSARLADAREKNRKTEEKTFARVATKDTERSQEILTPAQQREMRKRVADCQDVKSALSVIDGYIFGDETDGEVDKIDTDPETKDTRMFSEENLLEIIKPSTARIAAIALVGRMMKLRENVKRAEGTDAKLDALADLTTQTGFLSLVALAVDTDDERIMRLWRKGRK